MTIDSNLPRRTRQILLSIVRMHIDTGQPVASADVSRLRRHHLRAASIRNIMADLADDGYLQQPHASAGRLPTSKAYRAYVENIPQRRLTAGKVGRLREELGDAGTVEQLLERSSHLLTEMSRGVGIAAVIPNEEQEFEQVELLSLGERRVLMVLVTRGQEKLVRDQVVTLDEAIGQMELDSIRNFLNANYRGWALADLQAELRRRLVQASDAYAHMLRKLVMLYERGMLEAGLEPEIRMEGAANLFAQDLQWTHERLREIFRTLEAKKRILQLLERFLAGSAGQVSFQIGLEEIDPSLDELSLIGLGVRLGGGVPVKFAVLGPLRMDYERAVNAVCGLGQALRAVPS